MSYRKSRGARAAARLTLSLLVIAALGWLTIPSEVWNQFEPTAFAANFVVTTATDNGNNANPTPGSLRDAILKANA
ncbi:MAG TPA: hypothetical protein VEQ40_13270, partial [Pyrinomonadaceae bacterium]|nr:hypothetical protein [Pyrinomonadaceae bacterium]